MEDVVAPHGLIDLASEAVGGCALSASDEFFANKENLLRPGRGTFVPDKFTDRGKWMDGWESRRKRVPGHDWCVVRLGVRGTVRAVDIDTNHFLGNHPPLASLEGTSAPPDHNIQDLEQQRWQTVLATSPLRPGSQNLFLTRDAGVVSHVRLNIFPDGGVARLRIYGDVSAEPSRGDIDEEARRHVQTGEEDLAAMRSGGVALACSDMFFGTMNHLIAPGRAVNMGGGWETRRRRGPGHDWIVVALAARGEIGTLEIDTNHFKGNYPDKCMVEGVDATGMGALDLLAALAPWKQTLGETKLQAHKRHFFRNELSLRGPFTHLRLNVYPDGGVSRLRAYGRRL